MPSVPPPSTVVPSGRHWSWYVHSSTSSPSSPPSPSSQSSSSPPLISSPLSHSEKSDDPVSLHWDVRLVTAETKVSASLAGSLFSIVIVEPVRSSAMGGGTPSIRYGAALLCRAGSQIPPGFGDTAAAASGDIAAAPASPACSALSFAVRHAWSNVFPSEGSTPSLVSRRVVSMAKP